MRYLLILFVYISIFSSSYANTSLEISQLISKIKVAKASEKHLLINQLKIQLREANKETKARAMSELRNSLNSNNGVKTRSRLQQSTQSTSTQHNKMQNKNQKKQQYQQHQGKR